MAAQLSSLAGLNAIVVGAGFGGLAAAIELRRKGATVTVLESYPDMTNQGDVIMIGSNATSIMKSWGNVLDRLLAFASQPDEISIQDKFGKPLVNQPLPKDFNGNPNMYTSRKLAQHYMFDYAVSIGVQVLFGSRVTSYFETADTAGVKVNDQKFEGDVVIAADGVHSRARGFVMGAEERPQKSGFAVYRSWFPLENLAKDELTASLAEVDKPLFKIWIAEDTHAILTTNTKLQRATCFVTHKDLADIKEDWNLPGNKEDMARCVQGWDPLLLAIINQIPEDCLIDYKLLWRDPVSQWVSKQGRLCLLGDAAHPHLATSGTGGAQAIEDGTTVACLLERLGKANIPLALQAYTKLRYERTSLTQRMGWETRHVWHQTDWEAVAKNPDILKLPQPEWLNGHDAAKYVEEKLEEVLSHIRLGTPFTSTNVPDGHVHKDWTIAEMLAFEGKRAEEGFYQTRS